MGQENLPYLIFLVFCEMPFKTTFAKLYKFGAVIKKLLPEVKKKKILKSSCNFG
jgi:hypothetical protein